MIPVHFRPRTQPARSLGDSGRSDSDLGPISALNQFDNQYYSFPGNRVQRPNLPEFFSGDKLCHTEPTFTIFILLRRLLINRLIPSSKQIHLVFTFAIPHIVRLPSSRFLVVVLQRFILD
jgi:hypothetical protein